MRCPESSPAYLERVIEAFLDAMREAETMATAGSVDELAELLRFAADLIDIIHDGLRGSDAADAPITEVETLREMLDKARALLQPHPTLH